MSGRNGKWEFKKNDFSNYARKMHIQPGSVILFKDGTINREGLEEFGKAIQNIGIPKVILLVVNDVNDVKQLSEEEMNRVGWFRVEALSKMVIDRSKEISEKADDPGKEVDDDTKE
jgi:hypothetical protein